MNQYFYIDNEGTQKGTFSPEGLKNEHIKKETLVWTQGMSQWTRADEVSELQYIFADPVVAQAAPTVQTQPSVAPQPAGYANAAANAEVKPPLPRTYLIESILVTFLPLVLCGSFLSLLGIIAIVYSSQVESYHNRGNYNEAADSSRQAGKWTRITLWISIAWVALFVIGIILLIVFAGSMAGLSNLISS